MFQKLFSDEATRRRHRNAPFAEERERYLQHCADVGGTRATLLVKSTELLWFACHLDSSAPQGVDLEKLQEIVRVRQSIYKGATTARRLTDIARPWLRSWVGGAYPSSTFGLRINWISTSFGSRIYRVQTGRCILASKSR
jgi:hypothetical protein